MNARVTTATRLGFREQARRPLLLVLVVVLPFFFITRAIARSEPTPRRIGLPGAGDVLTVRRWRPDGSAKLPRVQLGEQVVDGPVAHEDDAERAVRAALRMLETLDGCVGAEVAMRRRSW